MNTVMNIDYIDYQSTKKYLFGLQTLFQTSYCMDMRHELYSNLFVLLSMYL